MSAGERREAFYILPVQESRKVDCADEEHVYQVIPSLRQPDLNIFLAEITAQFSGG